MATGAETISTEVAWDEVDRRLGAFLANPDDVETVHNLRISIRTLRSLLTFVSPLLKRRRHRLLQDDLRSVVVETSRLRECDVLLRRLRELDVPCAELDERVVCLRELERNHVVDVMRGRHARRALRRVRSGVGRVPSRDRVREEGVARVNVAMAREFPAEGLSAEARSALEELVARNQALVDAFVTGARHVC